MNTLIAGSDLSELQVLRDKLSAQGVKVDTASNGKELLEKLAQADAPRLAVIEYSASGINGLKVCQKIRKAKWGKEIYLIIVSYDAAINNLPKELEVIIDDYILNPSNQDELLNRINVGYRVLKRQIKLENQIKDLTQKLKGAHKIHEQTEKILREAIEVYLGLFKNAQAGLFKTRISDGKALDANERLVEIFGYDSREQFLEEYYAPEHYVDPNTRKQLLAELKEKGVVDNFPAQRIRRDGSTFWSLISAYPYPEKDYMLNVLIDTTKEKESLDALRESEERYRTLIETANDAIFIADVETGKIIDANKKAETLLGMPRKEIIGMHQSQLHPKEEAEYYKKIFKESVRTGKSMRENVFVVHKDGHKIPVETSASVSTIKGKKIIQGIFRDVSERKQAEEKIIELAKFPTENPNPVMRIKNDGLILFANTASQPILDEMEGKTGHYLTRQWKQLIKNIYHSQQHKQLEIIHFGQTFSMTITPIENSDYLNIYAYDITGRKQVEKTLQTSENLYRTLVENIRFGIALLDINHNIVMTNTAQAKMLKKDVHELIGKKCYMEFEKRGSICPHCPGVWAMSTGQIHEIETGGTLDDGTYVSVWVRAFPTYDADGTVTGFVEIVEDITERKLAEEQLKTSFDRFRTVMDSLDALVYVVDFKTYEILFVNKYGRETWGDILGQTCWMTLQSGQSGPCDFCTNPKLLDKNGNPTGVYRWEFKNTVTNHWYECRDRAIRWIDSRIVRLEIATDITSRKETEEKLKETLDKLSRSNKELQQFAYVASHDLQEPLRKMRSYSEMLEKRYSGQLDEKADKFIGYIVDGAHRMQNLINDLLTYSRVGRMDIAVEPTDIEKILEQVLTIFDKAIEKNHAVITHDPLPSIEINPAQMLQLLQNIVGNALKFRGTDPPRIHISAEKKESEWLFSIRDNGIGIEEEYFERIFIIFQRLHTRAEYPGTGIGLAICKRVVEYLGGRIWVESELGKGTIFYFTVPF